MADPFTPWIDFWKSSAQIALGTPQLIQHRLDLFGASWPCSPSTLIESQQMMWEKVLTAGEMWWTLWMGAWSPAALMGTRGWDGQQHAALRVVPTPSQPESPRDDAQVRRLRRG